MKIKELPNNKSFLFNYPYEFAENGTINFWANETGRLSIAQRKENYLSIHEARSKEVNVHPRFLIGYLTKGSTAVGITNVFRCKYEIVYERKTKREAYEAALKYFKMICKQRKENEYPWCSNSKRWIAVDFNLVLPKTCPNEAEKECEWEKCAYFIWRKETPYLKYKREIMKSYGMSIISSRKYYEDLEKEE